MEQEALNSSDRLILLVESLMQMKNISSGGSFNLQNTATVLSNISEDGLKKLSQYGDNHEAILEEAVRGTYKLSDLQKIIQDTQISANKIDGNLDTTSISMMPYTAEINGLVSQKNVDYEAVIKEVIKLGVVAQTSDLISSVSGVVPQSERSDYDVDKFNANLQAMSVVAMNIATEHGIDITKAIQDVQQEMGVDNAKPTLQEQGQPHRFSFQKGDGEPKETRSLRPTGSLSNEDHEKLLGKISDRYSENPHKSTSSNANNEEIGKEFLTNLEKTLAAGALEMRQNSIRSRPGPYGYFNLSTVEKLRDIEEIKGHWSTKSYSNSVEEWLNSDNRPDIQLDDAIKKDEHAGFRDAIGQNAELQERLTASITLQEPDYDDLRQRWIGVVDYYEQHGTLDGAEKIMDIDVDNIKAAIENGDISPDREIEALNEYTSAFQTGNFKASGDVDIVPESLASIALPSQDKVPEQTADIKLSIA